MHRQALFIAIIAAGIAFTYGGDNPEVTPVSEVTTDATLPTTITPANPNTTSTISPTTTTSASTTTSTTTAKPTTTTTSTTTTAATTMTTSIAPNTSSTAAPPTTTVAPPEPKSFVGNWNVTDSSTNETCIMIHMAIMFNVTYMNLQNKSSFATMYVPVNSTASGVCGKEDQNIMLTWGADGNMLNMIFKMNATEKNFKLSGIDVTIKPTEKYFPDRKEKGAILLNTGDSHFSTAVNKSYLCVKEQTIELMKKDTNETEAKMTLSHVQLQAFHSKNDTKFGDAQDCESSSTPDIVPIAVGCALVGLVAVVLIAYLVGRRRSQARGYLSM